MFKKKPIYKIKEKSEVYEQNVKLLQEIGYTYDIARLYALRENSLLTEDDLYKNSILSWESMLGVKDAVEILFKAIAAKKRICIVADYDSDGATSCAVGVLALRRFGANVNFIVPNRMVHGYGLARGIIDEAINAHNPDLIITVDNGIAAIDGVAYAKSLGIQVVVTDHHLPADTLPNADAIVDPCQPGCKFPTKNLAGCGVIFYVMSALKAKFETDLGIKVKIFDLLQLVAFGTLADLVKLDKNNRLIVGMGLNQMRKSPMVGLLALCTVANKNIDKLASFEIGYSLAPRINAAGRLEDMSLGINLLIEEDYSKAIDMAIQLNKINQERKSIEEGMTNEIHDNNEIVMGNVGCVIYSSTFHEGVVGIIASRMKENAFKPSIVFAKTHDNCIKGSGRSIPNVHLRDVLDYVSKQDSSIITKFGGHAMAAGLTIKEAKLGDFVRLFDEAILKLSPNVSFENVINLDIEVEDLKSISIDYVESLNTIVWGNGFEYPKFHGSFKIKEQSLLKNQHLRLVLSRDDIDIQAIWFFRGSKIELDSGRFMFSLSINDFAGRQSVQLIVEDMIEITQD